MAAVSQSGISSRIFFVNFETSRVCLVFILNEDLLLSVLGDLQAVQSLPRHRPVQGLARRRRRRRVDVGLRLRRVPLALRHERDRTPTGDFFNLADMM